MSYLNYPVKKLFIPVTFVITIRSYPVGKSIVNSFKLRFYNTKDLVYP